jgi:uncharacterized repeat protein (TIGR03803 family)
MHLAQPKAHGLSLLALCAGLSLVAHQANAASESVIYSFQGTKQDGANPDSDLTKVGPYLYGTAAGSKMCKKKGPCGVVFKIKPGSDAKVIHQFDSRAGYGTDSGLLAIGDTLYGTTLYGGAGYGSLYALTPPKSFDTVVNFPITPGPPNGGLSTDGSNYYGVTMPSGGQKGQFGSVYSVTTAGTVTVLYSFQGGTDGWSADAAPTPLNGTLYGTTFGGGAYGLGTVYAVAPNGTETILHSFSGTGDGASPTHRLLSLNGTLYGTTEGQLGSCGKPVGCGTIFQITPGGALTTLYSFSGTSDGAVPFGDLTALNGVIYGTTFAGGKSNTGTVFSITTGGVFNTIYAFGKKPDGNNPNAGLLADGKLLYGTTSLGGSANLGTVFTITP